MRLVSAVLFLALTGSGALADEANTADSKPEVMRHKVPFRVVKMLPETGQVLLFDRDHGSHVVAEVGQMLDGYRVDDLDDETVTLVAQNGTQIILAAPPPRLTRRAHARTPAAPAAPADPYADASAPATSSAASATEGAGTPVDPYAEPAPPRTPGEGGVRVASAADPATATSGSPAFATSGSPAPATVSASPRTASASAPTTAVLSDDPYADPGIAAFADAVDATPAPATATPAPARSEGPAIATAPSPAPSATPPASPASPPPPPALDDKGAALASALTGAPAPSSTAASPSAPASSSTAASPSAPASSSTAAASSAPVAPPPPDLASLSFDEPTSGAPSANGSHADVTTDRAPATSTASAGATTLARAELDTALANFSTLASSFRATFTPAGLRLDTVRDGTLLTRVGLRKGDVITSIDGQPLRSLDDAANLYARASSLRAATIQVTRAGTPITLRVAIR